MRTQLSLPMWRMRVTSSGRLSGALYTSLSTTTKAKPIFSGAVVVGRQLGGARMAKAFPSYSRLNSNSSLVGRTKKNTSTNHMAQSTSQCRGLYGQKESARAAQMVRENIRRGGRVDGSAPHKARGTCERRAFWECMEEGA